MKNKIKLLIETRIAEKKRNLSTFVYSNGTIQTVDVVGKLTQSHYTVPHGAQLIEVVVGKHVTEIGGFAFNCCSSIRIITIPLSVTAIRQYAFSGCSSLSSTIIPKSVTIIERYAFWGCTSLRLIHLPHTLTELGDQAFWNCTSLTSLAVPNGVEKIGRQAFWRVPHISYTGSAPGAPWGALTIN